ncbi:biotin--[acetyl-CoA-carboxylase] ligase [Methylobrevis pamukkalensis]|uniref:biotin--[biotin carboxyl-carrier protein] ligase n=1 Tax=Methylobrevis pamukkalensis TaxID=1439726 RepID=A0A1E3H857_9HYPH|nr:biotin--[acetyl-CoA-carboxylase] ligase [Methylobrevis pamukkalensis]ODN72484.1 Bifunctional ligase/repressor BirA [Methylobrevis pamukkalensis]
MRDQGPALPQGYRALRLETVGSTNAEALERAREGDPGPVWITARRQEGGRGRQGRRWTSEPGNLYASLLLTDPVEAARIGELPLVVAVAVHDAVAEVLPPPLRPRLAIKWPNDLLFDGAKITGILIEGTTVPAGRAVVIGIGINCAHYPDDAGYAATDLSRIGAPVTPDELFAILAEKMAARLAMWQTRGFAPLRDAWMARVVGIGTTIRVRLPREEHTGRFEALDAGGRLLLRRPDGRLETISAGDVFFGD